MLQMLIRIKNKNILLALPIVLLIFLLVIFNLKHNLKREEINLNELFHYGTCLIKQAGRQIVDIRKSDQLKIENKKNDKSLVTKADLESHRIIVGSLRAKFLNLLIRSEEDSNDHIDTRDSFDACSKYNKQFSSDLLVPIDDVTVWVDPLDATIEYTENLVEYVTIMLCIAINGRPRAGIIHSPFDGQMYLSFLNGTTNVIKKNNKKLNNTTRIIISRSHAGSVEESIQRNYENSEIIKAAGSGFKGLKVAQNEVDLYLHTTKIKKWDICAVDTLLTNQGGKLTNLNGDKIDYSSESNVYVDGLLGTLSYNPKIDTQKLNENF